MGNINLLYKERPGKITASRANDLMTRGRGSEEYGKTFISYAAELAAERVGVVFNTFETDAMAWGIETQPTAAAVYENSRKVTLTEPGFILHPDFPFIGCTPDYVVNEELLLEVKCPQQKSHLNYLLYGIDKAYILQMQFQMMVTGAKAVDYMSYNEDFPLRLMAKVTRVERDDVLIREMENRCLALEKHIKKFVEILQK